VEKYKILIKASAAKEIQSITTRKDRRRVVEKIRKLADDPRPSGCEKLSGQDRYRVRQGNYRIIYSIDDDRLVLHVVKVADRNDVYRN
jgi:mRNA interferase RelE/StbE